MKIEKNSRQIPKVKEICSNKKYYDIMYAYLQQISILSEGGKRLVAKSAINYTQLGQRFGISRQTASVKFKNLIDLGIVQEVDENNYELVRWNNNLAMLIPYDTLSLLVDALSENAINTYVYLFNRYYANDCKSFDFTLTQIKSFLGLCATTRSNDVVITHILFVLQSIGLLDFTLSASKGVKTIYKLDWISNRC